MLPDTLSNQTGLVNSLQSFWYFPGIVTLVGMAIAFFGRFLFPKGEVHQRVGLILNTIASKKADLLRSTLSILTTTNQQLVSAESNPGLDFWKRLEDFKHSENKAKWIRSWSRRGLNVLIWAVIFTLSAAIVGAIWIQSRKYMGILGILCFLLSLSSFGGLYWIENKLQCDFDEHSDSTRST